MCLMRNFWFVSACIKSDEFFLPKHLYFLIEMPDGSGDSFSVLVSCSNMYIVRTAIYVFSIVMAHNYHNVDSSLII